MEHHPLGGIDDNAMFTIGKWEQVSTWLFNGTEQVDVEISDLERRKRKEVARLDEMSTKARMKVLWDLFESLDLKQEDVIAAEPTATGLFTYLKEGGKQMMQSRLEKIHPKKEAPPTATLAKAVNASILYSDPTAVLPWQYMGNALASGDFNNDGQPVRISASRESV